MEDQHPIRAEARSLETARLLLRPYRLEDLDDIAEMLGDLEVGAHTFLGPRDRQQTAEVLAGYLSFTAERGYGMLAIFDRQTNQYLGECGLVAPIGPLALRYALARRAWGKGYATEASVAVLDDAFYDLGLRRLVAGVVPANAASKKIMAKLGFSEFDAVTVAGHEFTLFELTADVWKARRRG
jgi:ribosomal-protein-alanine N-acetyltransferase